MRKGAVKFKLDTNIDSKSQHANYTALMFSTDEARFYIQKELYD